MPQIVSITSQGQLTIPKSIRRSFGIKGSTKAVVWKVGDEIIVKPKNDFWDLKSILASKIRLTDSDLRKAREEFTRKWAREK